MFRLPFSAQRTGCVFRRWIIAMAVLAAGVVRAQHQHHEQDAPAPPPAPAQQPHAAAHPGHAPPMSFAGIPHARDASGTAWQPDATPMHAHMLAPAAGARWEYMAHYNVFAGYTHQSGPRGADQFNSINWAMLMASRRDRDGELMLRTMLSLEPWTTTRRGYPLLFQSGEAYQGRPIVDRQHPHDFFMELAGRYRRILAEDTSLSVYVAPAGEPALGPVAYPHRLSAMDNPAAPIGHHWLDSTHIAFGVLTAGVARGAWQIEGSWFNGREPDEDRWGIDLAPLDSYAGRLTWNVSREWSAQASIGYLDSPEELRPQDSLWRTTASLMHTTSLGGDDHLATTLAWGRNDTHGAKTGAVLLESSFRRGSWTAFGRAEYVEKPGEDLELEPHERRIPVRQLTLGLSRDLVQHRAWQLAIGGSVTRSFMPGDLKAVYGDRPTGYWIFLRLRPAAMAH